MSTGNPPALAGFMTLHRRPVFSPKKRRKIVLASRPASPANDSFPTHQPRRTVLNLSASEEELAEELVNSFMTRILGGRG
jgi:hypothetical protein